MLLHARRLLAERLQANQTNAKSLTCSSANVKAEFDEMLQAEESL